MLEEIEALVTPSFLAIMAQGQSSSSGLSVLVLQMAAIGLVFYFLILRPSGQARKRHAELLRTLKKGDEIMTSGGIIGRVKDIKEVEGDGLKEVRVTVESGTSTVVIERSRIVRVGSSAATGAPPA
ncbi:MAG TPA: preprotein translocase subunit YajC [Gemmatimonadales bacterium]|nr:preprotein translocase subunit YajC [Gemmatimonadales bacterium]